MKYTIELSYNEAYTLLDAISNMLQENEELCKNVIFEATKRLLKKEHESLTEVYNKIKKEVD